VSPRVTTTTPVTSQLAGFIERGEVTPSVGSRYGLDQVPAAIDDMTAGRTQGKSVIIVR
jgi:NADPH:quinone reductase-like Zn-dependent oxidoreductase